MKRSDTVRVRDLTFPESYNLRTVGTSQTLMNHWEACPVAFMLALNGYKGIRKTRITGFGSIAHEMVDRIYAYAHAHGKAPRKKRIKKWLNEYCAKEVKGVLAAKRSDEIVRDKAVAYVLLTEYVRFYPEDFLEKEFTDTEAIFNVKFRYGKKRIALCRGKKDARFLCDDERWLMENKTMGRISLDDIKDSLPLNNQNLFYVVMDEEEYGEEIAGVLYNIIRNPGHKQTIKDGSLAGFIKRLRGIVRKDPEHFFVRFEIPYTKADKAQYKRELKIKFREMNLLLRGKLGVYRRTTSCLRRFRCDYLDACTSGSLSMYDKVPLFGELQ